MFPNISLKGILLGFAVKSYQNSQNILVFFFFFKKKIKDLGMDIVTISVKF
jgi:hypothetical protein